MNVQDFIEGKETPRKPSYYLHNVVNDLSKALDEEIEHLVNSDEECEDGDSVFVEDELGEMKLIFTAYYYCIPGMGFVWIKHFDSLIIVDGLPKVMGTSNAEEFIKNIVDIFNLDGPDEEKE